MTATLEKLTTLAAKAGLTWEQAKQMTVPQFAEALARHEAGRCTVCGAESGSCDAKGEEVGT